MSSPKIDPQRVAEIVEEFLSLKAKMNDAEAAETVGSRYSLTKAEVLKLAKR